MSTRIDYQPCGKIHRCPKHASVLPFFLWKKKKGFIQFVTDIPKIRYKTRNNLLTRTDFKVILCTSTLKKFQVKRVRFSLNKANWTLPRCFLSFFQSDITRSFSIFAVAANLPETSPSKFFAFRTWVNTTLKGLRVYLLKIKRRWSVSNLSSNLTRKWPTLIWI